MKSSFFEFCTKYIFPNEPCPNWVIILYSSKLNIFNSSSSFDVFCVIITLLFLSFESSLSIELLFSLVVVLLILYLIFLSSLLFSFLSLVLVFISVVLIFNSLKLDIISVNPLLFEFLYCDLWVNSIFVWLGWSFLLIFPWFFLFTLSFLYLVLFI